MKAFIESLEDLNNGIMCGRWFDLSEYDTVEDLRTAIKKDVLDKSIIAEKTGQPAEEIIITDYDDAPNGLGEYESLESLIFIQELINETGEGTQAPLSALFTWLESVEELDYIKKYETNPIEVIDRFSASFYGGWESEIDFAEHYVEENNILADAPETLVNYFDYDAYARDLFIESFIFVNGWVFSRD